MSLRITIAFALLACVGCKTPSTGTVDATPPDRVVEAQRTDAPEAGPYEVARAWIAAPSDDPTGRMVAEWTAAHVERLHADGEDRYKVLVSSDDQQDAALLTVVRKDGTWVVSGTEVVRADYLWPSR